MKATGSLPVLLGAAFSFAAATYVLAPLLPIYFVETVQHGGLGWSKQEAFSLLGTLLALIYISPFIGGLLSDMVLGRPLTGLLGYVFFALGAGGIGCTADPDVVFWSIIVFGVGIGCIKVSLAATIGTLASDIRKKGYEYHFVSSTIGFSCAGLVSFPLFVCSTIQGVVAVCLGAVGVSLLLFLFLVGWSLRGRPQAAAVEEKATPSSDGGWPLFLLLLVTGVPFFISSNQLVTGMSIFLHQCVDRKIGMWEIPALWFGGLGSIVMALISPFVRRWWEAHPLPGREGDYAKLCVGAFVSACLFATTSVVAGGSSLLGVSVLLVVHFLSFLADFHVRPVLMASATSLTPSRYHTLATALVFGSIGLGGKLSGTLAGLVDTIGFPMLFGTCSCLSMICGLIAFILWRRLPRSIPKTA